MASCGEESSQFNDPYFSAEKLSLERDIVNEEPNTDEKETDSDEFFQEFASMDLFDYDKEDSCLNSDSDTDSEKDKVIDYSSDEEVLTDFDLENRRIYRQQIVSSGGFDLDVIPGNFYRIFFTLEPLEEDDEEYLKVCRFSRLGIDKYNKDNDANYEFVKYVKAVWSVCAGFNYYLTFEAKEAADCAPTTFQAMVYDGIPEKDESEHIEVVLVRMKSRASKEDNRILIGL